MAKVKNYIMAETTNVKAVRKLISSLEKRRIDEMCGLALVWGAPGLGKTRCLTQLGIQKRYIFIRLDSTTTQKSFIIRLRDGISYRYNLSLPQARGGTDKLFQECINYLNSNQTTIVIDEIDYAFSKRDLLGTIRDIVDDAPMTNVILVGMGEAHEKLKTANAHYFDRCNQFFKFKPSDKQDTKLICESLMNAELSEKIISEIHKQTGGVARKIVKEIQALDNIQSKQIK